MNKQFSKYFDFHYFLRFIIILLILRSFNFCFVGITDPKNYYSPFIDHNLNYIIWLRSSILNASNILAHAFGLNTSINGRIIKVFKGSSVLLGHPCIGIGIMSFWIAFIAAHKNQYIEKFQWCIIGVVAIWFLNCLRISLLLLALQSKWKVNKYVNHHDLFNYIVYTVILLMICLFYKINNEENINKLEKNNSKCLA